MRLWFQRGWACTEPFVLLVISALWARVGLDLIGMDRDQSRVALFTTSPAWGEAALAEAARMAIRWLPLLLVVWGLARGRGYSLLSPLRRAAPRWPVWRGLGLGIGVAFVLAPFSSLPRTYHFLVSELGEAPPLWGLIYRSPWTADFWIFMAVSSFLVVPVVEELFFRGYLLGNFGRLWRPPTAMAASAALFAVAHLQYAALDPFALYNMLLVFVGGLATAWLVWRTGSLLPAILEHAYANLPRPVEWAGLEIAGAVVGGALIYVLLRWAGPPGDKPLGAPISD